MNLTRILSRGQYQGQISFPFRYAWLYFVMIVLVNDQLLFENVLKVLKAIKLSFNPNITCLIYTLFVLNINMNHQTSNNFDFVTAKVAQDIENFSNPKTFYSLICYILLNYHAKY